MELRNKKTGLVGELHYEPDKEYHFTVVTEDSADMAIYRTLAELNEEWEDYKPKEPLIKDEKIRRAVKAWAEANDIDGVSYHKSSHFWYLRALNDHEQAIDFWLSYDAEPEMVENKYYTITELCGEEE